MTPFMPDPFPDDGVPQESDVLVLKIGEKK